MSQLAKLNLKSIERVVQQDRTENRRRKLIAALAEQQLIFEAQLKGETYAQTKKRWVKGANGERTQKERQRTVQPWFFERDAGWYVQCKYGSRTLTISGKSNAVFVSKLDEVGAVLDTLAKAAQAGELDKAIDAVTRSKAAKAAT
jgi:hypothetical protein